MNPMRVFFVALMMVAGCGGSTPTGGGGGTGGTAGGGGAAGGGGTGGAGGASWLTGEKGTLLSSADGTSFLSHTAPTSSDLYALTCVGHLDGWAAGADGVLMGTHDGGYTWALEPSGVTSTLRALSFADKLHGLAVGDAGVVLRTVDGGEHWSPVVSNTTADLYGVAMSRFDGRAFVVGAGGVLLRSSGRRRQLRRSVVAGVGESAGGALQRRGRHRLHRR